MTPCAAPAASATRGCDMPDEMSTDPADIIAGALQISRGHAIEILQQAVDAILTARPTLTQGAAIAAGAVRPGKIEECYGDCPTDPKTCANPCNFVGRASHGQVPAGATPSEPSHAMYAAAQKILIPTGDDDGGSILLNTSQVRALWQSMLSAASAAPGTPASFQGRVERHSDQSVLVVFPSCRLASEFECSLSPAFPTIEGESNG